MIKIKSVFLIMIICFFGCNLRRNSFMDRIEIVYDTTLCVRNLDVVANVYLISDSINNNVIDSKEKAFEIIKSHITSIHEVGIDYDRPIVRMNLLGDSLWILEISEKQHKSKNIITIGNTIYFEVNKNNGEIVKFVIEE